MSPLLNGAEFILDAPDHVPAVWGDEHGQVLWAKGEPMLLTGQVGVGKSTVLQQVVRARLGIGDGEVLGFAVAHDERRVLYIAADRPSQIARSMRRMFTDGDRDVIGERLAVWRGPLGFNVLDEPHAMTKLAERYSAGTVVIDSLSDVASPLSSDDVGSAVKLMMTMLTEAGIEVAISHHQRKGGLETKNTTTIDDVYGSRWITSGAGSVVYLHGSPGDPVVELRHLKQPAEEVGPLQVIHDHQAGTSRVEHEVDLYDLLKDRGTLTVPEAACLLHGPSPDRNQREKTRRKLDGLVTRGHARKGETDVARATVPYLFVERTVQHRAEDRAAARNVHAPARLGSTTVHAPCTHEHGPALAAPAPLRGAANADRAAPRAPLSALTADVFDEDETCERKDAA